VSRKKKRFSRSNSDEPFAESGAEKDSLADQKQFGHAGSSRLPSNKLDSERGKDATFLTEQEARLEAAKLGLVPTDPARLEPGIPLSDEDWTTLFRFHRGEIEDEAELLRIIRLRTTYTAWYEADRQVFLKVCRESAQARTAAN
jgi:hypothetical protein